MHDYGSYLQKHGEYGEIIKFNYPILTATGLPGAKQSELVILESGEMGQVFALHDETLDILLFSQNKIQVGTKISRSGELLMVPVGEELLGAMIDPLGLPYPGHKDQRTQKTVTRSLDVTPLGIAKRARITKQLMTGTSIVDMMIPIGMGQKELILGDRKAGKTSFVRAAVINQVQKGAVAIYASVGKTRAEIKYLEEFLQSEKMKQNMILVATSSSDSPGLIYLTPFTAMTLAEYFRDQGRNVIVIMDDLLTHAKFYREFSLLAQTFPGRDSYPGDVFHIHAKLLERAGNYKHEKVNEVSISCLPVAGTLEGDLTGFIVSNLMSITDGHIFFDSNIFAKGRRPAINTPLSVTRVGKQTQDHLTRDINRELSSFFAIHDRVENLSHFGSELTESVKSILATGDRIYEFFNQPSDLTIPLPISLVLFALVWLNMLSEINVPLEQARDTLISAYQYEEYKTFFKSILAVETLNDLLRNVRANKDTLQALWTKQGK